MLQPAEAIIWNFGKVACKSAHGYKKAATGVIALTNELANLNVKYPIYVHTAKCCGQLSEEE